MVTDVTGAPATTQAASSAAVTEKATGLTSDFETFLKMLTAQARYQDPLEPIDSSEYAAQLAQFSMVEQQVQGNDILASVQQQLGLANMAAMSGWVGMEARAAAPAYFDGSSPITVSPNPASIADTVQLVVRDSDGNEVQRIDLPVTADAYEWTGVDDDGVAFEEGMYTFNVESIDSQGEVLLSEMAEIYTEVKETQMQGGDVVLILDGGSAILSSSVTALRDPAS